MAKRAEGAHNNGIETLPVFYGAVVSVQFIFSLTTKQETSLRNTTTFQKENSVSQDGQSLRRHFATRNEFLKRLFGSRDIFLALRKFVYDTHTTQRSDRSTICFLLYDNQRRPGHRARSVQQRHFLMCTCLPVLVLSLSNSLLHCTPVFPRTLSASTLACSWPPGPCSTLYTSSTPTRAPH